MTEPAATLVQAFDFCKRRWADFSPNCHEICAARDQNFYYMARVVIRIGNTMRDEGNWTATDSLQKHPRVRFSNKSRYLFGGGDRKANITSFLENAFEAGIVLSLDPIGSASFGLTRLFCRSGISTGMLFLA